MKRQSALPVHEHSRRLRNRVIDALTQLENTRDAYKQGIPVAAFLQLYRHNQRDIIRFGHGLAST